MKAGAKNLRIARDAPERALLWRAHTAALAGLGRAANAFIVQDPAVPPSKLPALLRRVRTLAGRSRLEVVLTARAGEGILHPIVLYDARVPGEATQAQELGDAITDACVEAGGTITAEYGVGIAGRERLQVVVLRAPTSKRSRACAPRSIPARWPTPVGRPLRRRDRQRDADELRGGSRPPCAPRRPPAVEVRIVGAGTKLGWLESRAELDDARLR